VNNKSYLYLGLAVATLFVLAIVVSSSQNKALEDEVSGDQYLTELKGRINDVAGVEVSFSNMHATVLKKDDSWVLKEKNDHPVDFSHVKNLILSLSELKTVEPKTKKSENYEKLGVQDHVAGTANKLITLNDGSGNKIAAVILGTVKGDTLYIRRQGEEQAWLVKGRIETPGDEANWLDKQILDLDPAKIKSVAIEVSKKEKILIEKAKSEDKDFNLANAPKGKTPASASAVNALANNFRKLEFSNVYADGQVDLKKAEKAEIKVETFDGLLVDMAVYKQEEKDYLIVAASATDMATTDIQAQKDNLSKRWKPWVYEIPSFKATNLRKKLSDIVK